MNCQGIEYKITLNKITGHSVRMAAGILAVNFSFRESGNFPAYYDFDNADKWLEFILPNNGADLKLLILRNKIVWKGTWHYQK